MYDVGSLVRARRRQRTGMVPPAALFFAYMIDSPSIRPKKRQRINYDLFEGFVMK